MKEKQKSCISVVKKVTNSQTFDYDIYIPHKVDIIRVTSLGGLVYDSTPILVDDIFYITSNLIYSGLDNIVGLFCNPNYNIQSSPKEFRTSNPIINGSYNFEIRNINDRQLITYFGDTQIFINMEFIELEKNDST